MRGVIQRSRGWAVFFGSVGALLVLAVSGLFTVHLMERDQEFRVAQARAQEQQSEQAPPPVMPDAGAREEGEEPRT